MSHKLWEPPPPERKTAYTTSSSGTSLDQVPLNGFSFFSLFSLSCLTVFLFSSIITRWTCSSEEREKKPHLPGVFSPLKTEVLVPSQAFEINFRQFFQILLEDLEMKSWPLNVAQENKHGLSFCKDVTLCPQYLSQAQKPAHLGTVL